MPKSPEPEGSPRLMTTAEIAKEHDVSRQTIHTYRRTGIFPAPVEGEGNTRPRFREDEVVAFFEANPKQPRKKRRPQPQQGDPVAATTDPRIPQLAEAAHRVAREKATKLPEWKDLPLSEREKATAEARLWLRAAVEAGIAPPLVAPSDKHMAVYVVDGQFLYSDYPTSPPSDSVQRLLWASEMAESLEEIRDAGHEVRLIGWSE